MSGYLVKAADPASLVLDLRIAHDRMGSSADPSLNGHLKYPNNLDQSLNDPATDKIRKYRVDYNNRPPSVVSFMHAIASTPRWPVHLPPRGFPHTVTDQRRSGSC